MGDFEEPCVRLFLSVDLVGSTAFKNRRETELSSYRNGPPWANVFQEFYAGFPRVFERQIGHHRLDAPIRPRLVKAIGDELLLQTPIESSHDAQQVVRHFAVALVDYKSKNLSDHQLSLKGTAWIAGFPINNFRVSFEQEDGRRAVDFIGPSIDTGFRLTSMSSPRMLTVSVDLALLLLQGDGLDLYFGGTHNLKGVLGGKPYPHIWYKVAGDDAELHTAELRLSKQTADKDALKQYCEHYIEGSANTWLIRPYLKDDDRFSKTPEWHKQVLETFRRVDAENLKGADESEPPSA